jgi:ADP-heptose:LPS heptosyltransferase
VEAHNAVNRRLDKREMTLETAKGIWAGAKVATRTQGGRETVSLESMDRIPEIVLVDCLRAKPASRANFVTCSIGRYGGMPHVAECGECRARRSAGLQQYRRRVGCNGTARLAKSRSRSGSIDVRKQTPQKLLLRSSLSPGDIVTMTAAVRDLHRAYPGRFLTAVETTAPELWEHNPHVVARNQLTGSRRTIEMHYPLVNQSNQRPTHFIQGYAEYLGSQLGLRIPITEFRGDIHLSEEEKRWTNQVEQKFGYPGRFWIIVAGGKYDFTTKWWPPHSYQQVVDHFKGRVQFVQCGQKEHWHPELKDVFNLVGKTSVREFVRLVYHAEGIVCPVTFAMHLSAAVPAKDKRLRPCIVIAGGREPPHWEAYPGHQFLHTIGCLPCCATGGCWKSRCQTVGDGDAKDKNGLCDQPVQIDTGLRVPRCMTLIRPEDVCAAVERSSVYA